MYQQYNQLQNCIIANANIQKCMYWWEYRTNISLNDNKNQNGMKIADNKIIGGLSSGPIKKGEDINADKRGDTEASKGQ